MKEMKKSYSTPKLNKIDVRSHTLGSGTDAVDTESLESTAS